METRLKLTLENVHNKTVITNNSFTGPVKIGTPNSYGEVKNIVLMMASPGLLMGDTIDYEIECKNNSRVKITEQSYTKIFNTKEGCGKKYLNIIVKENASLFFCPFGVIPFEGSRVLGETNVQLEKNCQFFYSDIFAAGRIGMNEKFKFIEYRNRMSVKISDDIAWIDNVYLNPLEQDLNDLFFFNGYTHVGTIYYYGPEEKQEKLKEYNTDVVFYGISKAKKGICIKMLANNAQDIEDEIINLQNILK